MSTIYHDNYKSCPHCGETGKLRFSNIPESTLSYTLKGVECVDYLPPLRDYKCKNCSGEFLLFTDEYLDDDHFLDHDGEEE